ncbi:hypothetical protein OEZ85_009165 [Tetradesmus obliquus]|uniref:N-acylglucosamine 2-epimerase n=1 Tax=Tetradesmus obliquus TaxID=3088 RepID=A0ABY8TL66_TETOB|nr:hypothetical protein OEZ85_009165 [Tetradesmus obliquus]
MHVSTQGLVADTLTDLAAIRRSVYHFWACNGLDEAYGGFHGTLQRDGSPTPPADKGLVQGTRHAWAFSTFHLHGYRHAEAGSKRSSTCSAHAPLQDVVEAGSTAAERPSAAAAAVYGQTSTGQSDDDSTAGAGQPPLEGDEATMLGHKQRRPTSQQLARSAFEFVVSSLLLPDTGLLAWMASRNGSSILQDNTVLYGQWFVLYGFSQYYAAFGDVRAQQYALDCFAAVDAAWHNSSTGGYTENFVNSIPDEALAPVDSEMPRTLNVLMHGMEALAALHRISGHPTVLQRLLELLDILCARLAREQGLLYEAYLPAAAGAQWQPAPGQVVVYGHNLESTWLVADTLDYLLGIEAIPPATAAAYRAAAMNIGAAAVQQGYDAVHGGVFESGLPGRAPNSTAKVWWVQAESMMALWKLWQHSGEVGYLRKLAHSTRFVRQHVLDNVYGEMFWQVEADGTSKFYNNTNLDTKGNMWKASYHSARAPLFLERWMTQQ